MAHTTVAGSGPRAGRREWIGLAVLALPALLVSVDVFVLLLALPRLSVDLGASSTQQLWIMDVYGFMLSGFLVTMGTLGDRIGRRRLLLIGAAGFGLASVLAAYSTNPAMLIGARALLGVAGATLAPSTLALISNMFRDASQRALAIGIWFCCFMGGAALGPVVGGAMLQNFWWGSVFLLGVPAMLVLLVVGPVLLPEYRDAGAGRVDLASVALSLAAILPIIYGLKEFARAGLRPLPAAAMLAGVALGALFVRRQRGLADPLLDLHLFADRTFSAALGSMLFGTMLMGAIMLFTTQHLQLVEGLSPLHAGLWMLPAMAASAVSFLLAPLLARRIRPAHLIGAGLAISVTGLLVLTQVGVANAAHPRPQCLHRRAQHRRRHLRRPAGWRRHPHRDPAPARASHRPGQPRPDRPRPDRLRCQPGADAGRGLRPGRSGAGVGGAGSRSVRGEADRAGRLLAAGTPISYITKS